MTFTHLSGSMNSVIESHGVMIAKIFTIVFLFVVSVLMGVLPSKWEKFRRSPKLIGYANSFAAGLFLGVGVFHVLPEGVADYAKYRTMKGKSSSGYPEETFPLIFFCAVLGYCAILFLDKVALSSNELESTLHGHSHGHADIEDGPCDSHEEGQLLTLTDAHFGHHEDHSHSLKTPYGALDDVSQISSQDASVIIPPMHNQDAKNAKATPALKGGFEPFIIMVALSFHAVFEGIAIGLEDQFGPTLNLCTAVIIHKWAEALTLGISLMKANASPSLLLALITIFAASSPLGIIIGWYILQAPLIVAAIFKAIATGTFLYLAATEIAPEEFSEKSNRCSKFSCFMLGVGFISFVTYYA